MSCQNSCVRHNAGQLTFCICQCVIVATSIINQDSMCYYFFLYGWHKKTIYLTYQFKPDFIEGLISSHRGTIDFYDAHVSKTAVAFNRSVSCSALISKNRLHFDFYRLVIIPFSWNLINLIKFSFQMKMIYSNRDLFSKKALPQNSE